MKKQLLALAVLTAGISNAQSWSENFTGVTPPALPATWVQANIDGLTVNSALSSFSFATNAAVTRDLTGSFPAYGKMAVMTSWYTAPATSNDWLITPSFTVPVNGYLEFDAVSSNGSYKEYYDVKLSVGTGTAPASFTTTLLSVPGENTTITHRALSLNTYSNQVVRIAFVDNSYDKELMFLDNVSVQAPAANDILLKSVAPVAYSSFGTVGSTKTISGVVTNNGYTPITSFTAQYSANGGAPVSQVFTIPSLGYSSTASFSFSTAYSIAAPTEASIKVWSKVTGDALATNDTLKTGIKGYSSLPNHKVVFEEGTGTWCQYCPRGAVYMDSMHVVNPNTTALIAVHNGSSDPMKNTIYDAGIGTLISGYPSALCDRAKAIIDPSQMFTQYAAHINDFGLADLAITKNYNITTRVADITVKTTMASGFSNNTSSNDYRLAVAFTEDNVRGTTSGYNQVNAYSGGSTALVGAGLNWQTAANPVPAAIMKYDFVARTILGGFLGQASSLPSVLVAGTSYTSSVFSYTIPSTYNAGNMKAIVLLIDAKTNIIYNANTTTITPLVIGVEENKAENIEVSIYPNPAQNSSSVELNLVKDDAVTITVLSVMGQVVFTQTLSNLKAGKQTVSLNTENWATGIYNVNISTSNGNVSRKLEVIK
jgi:hypothetical protein